jgi:hypothetical protein
MWIDKVADMRMKKFSLMCLDCAFEPYLCKESFADQLPSAELINMFRTEFIAWFLPARRIVVLAFIAFMLGMGQAAWAKVRRRKNHRRTGWRESGNPSQ